MELEIHGVPTDYGANRRGVDMGPSAVRYAGIVDALAEDGHKVTDEGNVEVPLCDESGGSVGLEPEEGEARRVYERVADRVADSTDSERVPVTIGGDHSVSMGSLLGTARGSESVGVLWLDAHADFNTRETTPSGNVHGMALAAATGYGSFGGEWSESIDASNVALVGLRDVDGGERENLHDSDASSFTIPYIDREGIASVVERALGSTGSDSLHVSLDMDLLDPNEAPGVGTPVEGGVTYREAHTALEIISEEANVRSADLVEISPVLDESNRTAKLAVKLLRSLFGKKVL